MPAAGAALVAGVMMLIATAAQAKLQACQPPTGTPPAATISQCCQITKPGDYTVIGSLTGSGGACIKISASGVTLYGGGTATLAGNGTGVGIRLLPSAKGDVVYNFSSISNFKTGILDDAPRSVITSTWGLQSFVQNNTANGIVIRASRVYLSDMIPNGNGGNGILVEPLAPATVVSNVSLDNDTSYGNKGDGLKIVDGHADMVENDRLGNIEFPNQANGLEVRNSAFDTLYSDNSSNNDGDGMLIVNGEGENIASAISDNNGGSGIHLKRMILSRINGGSANANTDAGIWLDGSRGINVWGSTSLNTGTTSVYIGCSPNQVPDGTTCASRGLPASNGNRVAQGSFDTTSGVAPEYGIGIDRGNHNNQVLDNQVGGDSLKDLIDENKNCDSNLWMFNSFSTASPSSCIQ